MFWELKRSVLLLAIFRVLACIYNLSEKIVYSDQMASEKPADLDLHCLQNRIYRAFSIVGTNELI